MKRFIFLIVAIVITLGCSEDPNDQQQKLIVKTDKNNYSINEIIIFSINNSSSTTAHLASCCTSVAFYIDRNENNNWVEHSNFGLPCLALCPGIDLTLNYFEILTDSIFLDESGTFRIRIPYTFNPDQNWTGEILSNSFTIE
ncbi:MAG TPA: hypothetical protein VF870_10850 [Ignavibacteriaceae bacterium]|jgi:hypothetical protein